MVEAARLHRAKWRRQTGRTLIEGPNVLEDALKAGVDVETVFTVDAGLPPGSVVVDERALARLAGTKSPRGPVGVIAIPEPELVGTRDILVSHGVSDPGNVGALIRIAAAYGWAFGYTAGTADPWAPKVLRAGAGGHFQTPIVPLDSLPDLPTVASVPDGGGEAQDVDEEQLALLVGEESSGLPAEVIERATYRVSIPTPGGTESLNAAVAAGILVHLLSNR